MSTEAQINRQNIRGLDFPCSKFFTREKIERALDYSPNDDDIIISTYPKTGTTWVQYIIYEILNDGKELPSQTEMNRIIPYMEKSGVGIVENLQPPRVLKYHLPYGMTPHNPKTRYITIIRNPFDVVVSYYHFLRQITSVNLNFDDLFEAFVEGRSIYGDYFDHILSWYEHKNDENVLLLSFDKMKKDPRTGLLLIAKFLGRDLEGDDKLIGRILKHTSFGYMKANVRAMEKENGSEKKSERVDFFRSGGDGGKRSLMTETQKQRLRERMENKLKGFDIQRFWN